MYRRESIAYDEHPVTLFLPTIGGMQTTADASAADLASPLAGWEVATRWNRATFDWVAKGWQQWIALMTTLPPHFVASVPSSSMPSSSVTPAHPSVTRAQAGAQEARMARPSKA